MFAAVISKHLHQARQHPDGSVTDIWWSHAEENPILSGEARVETSYRLVSALQAPRSLMYSPLHLDTICPLSWDKRAFGCEAS